jgi:hypothetical protein
LFFGQIISVCTLLDSVCSSKTVAKTGVFFSMAQLLHPI